MHSQRRSHGDQSIGATGRPDEGNEDELQARVAINDVKQRASAQAVSFSLEFRRRYALCSAVFLGLLVRASSFLVVSFYSFLLLLPSLFPRARLFASAFFFQNLSTLSLY